MYIHVLSSLCRTLHHIISIIMLSYPNIHSNMDNMYEKEYIMV